MVFGCISAFIALHVIDLHYTMSYNSQNKHKKLKMELRRILFLELDSTASSRRIYNYISDVWKQICAHKNAVINIRKVELDVCFSVHCANICITFMLGKLEKSIWLMLTEFENGSSV